MEQEPIKEKKIIRDIRKENFNEDKMLREIRTLFEPEEKYYEPIRIGNAFSSNYIEYESNGDKDKTLLIEGIFNKIRPYLSMMMNYLKTQGEWKIQLAQPVNFISSKDSNETRTMHSNSDNTEIVLGYKADEIMEELFDFFLQKNGKRL